MRYIPGWRGYIATTQSHTIELKIYDAIELGDAAIGKNVLIAKQLLLLPYYGARYYYSDNRVFYHLKSALINIF